MPAPQSTSAPILLQFVTSRVQDFSKARSGAITAAEKKRPIFSARCAKPTPTPRAGCKDPLAPSKLQNSPTALQRLYAIVIGGPGSVDNHALRVRFLYSSARSRVHVRRPSQAAIMCCCGTLGCTQHSPIAGLSGEALHAFFHKRHAISFFIERSRCFCASRSMCLQGQMHAECHSN